MYMECTFYSAQCYIVHGNYYSYYDTYITISDITEIRVTMCSLIVLFINTCINAYGYNINILTALLSYSKNTADI